MTISPQNLRRSPVALICVFGLIAISVALYAHRASAATVLTYTTPGYPTTGSVSCNNGDQYGTCTLYPVSSIRTSDANYRNWNDASWLSYPYTQGQVVYTDGSGNWLASYTAPSGQNTAHLGSMNSVKAMCANPYTSNATNTFTCQTTTP